MAKSSSYSSAAPFGWLAFSGAVLFGLVQLSPTLYASVVGAAALSMGTIILATGSNIDKSNRFVPYLGAALFAMLCWIAVSLVPSSPVEAGVAAGTVLTARSLVVLSAVVLVMPVLAFIEMLFSLTAVQAISQFRGHSVLDGELRVVSMIDQKFGGVFGGLNR